MPSITHNAKIRRQKRVRSQLKTSSRLRLSVFRSLRHLYAQIIDDQSGNTLLSLSTHGFDAKITKTKQAALLGQKLAQAAAAKKISLVKFDRGPYQFHGRLKALANSAKAGGLKF
jgi:large subunit ribosomal protein L18